MLLWLLAGLLIGAVGATVGDQVVIDIDSPKFQHVLHEQCPDYEQYSQKRHAPFSSGPLNLPLQRPPEECRTFHSKAVEELIVKMNSTLAPKYPDLARLFENTFPNTLDTTIKYHQADPPLTFVVTGDINAEWLRDSQRQLSPYVPLTVKDPELQALVKGAIALQARYVSRFPFCNAFHPPAEAHIPTHINNENDRVYPRADLRTVFECKYELDSVASFFGLSNDYAAATGDLSFMTPEWLWAVKHALRVADSLKRGTYNDKTGQLLRPAYLFQRHTDSGSETLPNHGAGNPTKYTGLIRSYFRPSDDACIYQFLIPANAQMAVELRRLAAILPKGDELTATAKRLGTTIERAIYEYGVVNHPKYGKVFAYEVDGYGGTLLMDDANIPSLLALPDMGFVDVNDKIYQNTRKMILATDGNPYYIKGPIFEGVGGPHIGTRSAWPMSRIVAMRTTSDAKEIAGHLHAVVSTTKGLGLIHESINVDTGTFTRPWFAWANAEFAKSIVHLDKHNLLSKVLKEFAKLSK